MTEEELRRFDDWCDVAEASPNGLCGSIPTGTVRRLIAALREANELIKDLEIQ